MMILQHKNHAWKLGPNDGCFTGGLPNRLTENPFLDVLNVRRNFLFHLGTSPKPQQLGGPFVKYNQSHGIQSLSHILS